MTPTLLRGGLVFDGRVFAANDVLFADGRIAAVGPGLPAPAGAVVIELDGDLVMPGLVNAHHHSPDNLNTGRAAAAPLELWSLGSVPSRPSAPDELRAAALFGAALMLRSGVTGVVDMVRLPGVLTVEPFDAVAGAYLDAGMRAAIAPVLTDLPVERTLPLAEWRDAPADAGAVAASLAVVEELARRWRGRDGRLDVHVAPSGPQRCSDELLDGAVALSRRLGTRLHTHALETRSQAAQARRRWGVPLIKHLERIGALGPATVLAHLVWPEPEEIAAVAASRTVVVHNPASNATLGSGRAPIPDLLARGATVALGTDAATCNDGLSMFEAMKLMTILHRPDEAEWGRWPTAVDALTAATRGGAAALGIDGLGAVTISAPADLVVLDHEAAAFVPPNDLLHQMVMRAGAEVVLRVYVAGRLVVDAGRVLTVDLPAVAAELCRIAASRSNGGPPDAALAGAIAEMLRAERGGA